MSIFGAIIVSAICNVAKVSAASAWEEWIYDGPDCAHKTHLQQRHTLGCSNQRDSHGASRLDKVVTDAWGYTKVRIYWYDQANCRGNQVFEDVTRDFNTCIDFPGWVQAKWTVTDKSLLVAADSCSNCKDFAQRAQQTGKIALEECNKMCNDEGKLNEHCPNLCALVEAKPLEEVCTDAKLWNNQISAPCLALNASINNMLNRPIQYNKSAVSNAHIVV